MGYFTKRKSLILKGTNFAIRIARKVMVEHGIEQAEADAILDATRTRYMGMLDDIPDAGAEGGFLRSFTGAAAGQLAFWLEMKDAGYSAVKTWQISEEVARRGLDKIPGFMQSLSGWLFFTNTARKQLAKGAALSKEKSLGGWVFDYEDGGPDDDFDFKVEYKSCAIQQYARQIGAEEMGPYVCLFDISSSEAFGWGLKRTQTIGQGCTSCDFEFKKGAPTRVTVPEELGLGE